MSSSRTMQSSAEMRRQPLRTRRQPLHNSSSGAKKLSPSSAHHDPEEYSDDEDIRDPLYEDYVEDDNDDIEEVCDETTTPKKKNLYPPLSSLPSERSFVSAASRKLLQSHPAKTENVPSSFACSFLKKVVPVVILVFAVIVPCYLSITSGSTPDVIEPSMEINVNDIIHKLKERFDGQPNLSYRIIKTALDNVIASHNAMQPSAPAILLLMSTKGAKAITTSFAELLAKLVAAGEKNYQTIHGEQLKREDPDAAKKKIDDLIIDTVEKKEQKVVLIKDLDVIPSKAVMMLHNYCDHENARYKNAVFIMTIGAEADISNKSDSRQFDEAAELHLSSVWRDLAKDNLRSLFSRITVSVAAIYRTHH